MTERSNSIKMLRIEQVEEKVGYKKSTIFEWLSPTSARYKPHFPAPRKNGRSNRWFESEIDGFCILEFGCINSRLVADRAAVANTKGELFGNPPPLQPTAIEAAAKVAGASSKPNLAKTSRPTKSLSFEENDEGLQGRATKISKGKIVTTQLTAPPLSAAELNVALRTQRMANFDESSRSTGEIEFTTSSPGSVPVTNIHDTATIAPTEPNTTPRVIGVILKKRRTFVYKD